MAVDATTWVMTHPSHIEPGIVLNYTQKSDFIYGLAGGKLRVQLSSEDKNVYVKQLAVRTKVAAGQATANQLPSCSITTGLASAPVYRQQVRAEYDHHQTAMMGMWGASIVDAQRLAMRQGHYIGLRNKFLYGMIPSNGEGIVNTTGITTIALPPDSFGNQTVSSYDNGQMLLFLLGIFKALKARTYQFGQASRFVILGPQQDVGSWELSDIVQLTSYQRPGGGTMTVGQSLQQVLDEANCELIIGYDDTLIGQGPGGTDLILFLMPEVRKPEGAGPNTNEFAQLLPGMPECILQYSDVAAPIEIPTPLPGGAIDVLSEMSATTGWCVRPEVVSILYAAP